MRPVALLALAAVFALLPAAMLFSDTPRRFLIAWTFLTLALLSVRALTST